MSRSRMLEIAHGLTPLTATIGPSFMTDSYSCIPYVFIPYFYLLLS